MELVTDTVHRRKESVKWMSRIWTTPQSECYERPVPLHHVCTKKTFLLMHSRVFVAWTLLPDIAPLCKKEFPWAVDVGSLHSEPQHWTSSWHHTSIKNFLHKMSLSKLRFGKKKSVFIKNSWPQWSDNAVFWYQQMFCLTCSLKLYSVPSYLSFPVAICWLWDVMYVPYSYARQFASNTTARNELHKMLVAITPYFPNHMEHNTLKPIDTFFYYSSDP